MKKAWLEIDPSAQLSSRSLCSWRILERNMDQEENGCVLTGLLEVVLREDGQGWLRTETTQHSGLAEMQERSLAGEQATGKLHTSWTVGNWGGSSFPTGGNAQVQLVAKPSGAEEDGWKMRRKSLKITSWPSQGWKSYLGVQLWKQSLLEAYSSPWSDHKRWHSLHNCHLGSLSLCAGYISIHRYCLWSYVQQMDGLKIAPR